MECSHGPGLDHCFSHLGNPIRRGWTGEDCKQKGLRLFEQRKALKIFPFLMFPWMQLDLQPIGWAFRISGAWVAALFFQVTGFEVDREGVYLVVEGAPIVVDAACSGLNALQSMCVAGSLIAFWTFQPSRAFWCAVAVLPLFAWVANTLRIGMIGVASRARMAVWHRRVS